ncbi:hypothetical protein, partial [Pleionea sp. CnH1-48]|uniref:hypothetical protein n=1 Tax=Pleionea sp. CnH1-48 TaxID=2954494 RepID=UPI002096DE9C
FNFKNVLTQTGRSVISAGAAHFVIKNTYQAGQWQNRQVLANAFGSALGNAIVEDRIHHTEAAIATKKAYENNQRLLDQTQIAQTHADINEVANSIADASQSNIAGGLSDDMSRVTAAGEAATAGRRQEQIAARTRAENTYGAQAEQLANERSAQQADLERRQRLIAERVGNRSTVEFWNDGMRHQMAHEELVRNTAHLSPYSFATDGSNVPFFLSQTVVEQMPRVATPETGMKKAVKDYVNMQVAGAEIGVSLVSNLATEMGSGLVFLTTWGATDGKNALGFKKELDKEYRYDLQTPQARELMGSIAETLQPVAKSYNDFKESSGDVAFTAFGNSPTIATAVFMAPDVIMELTRLPKIRGNLDTKSEFDTNIEYSTTVELDSTWSSQWEMSLAPADNVDFEVPSVVPNNIPDSLTSSQLGNSLGRGLEKDVRLINGRDDIVVGVSHTRNTLSAVNINEEIKNLNKLSELGFPVVKNFGRVDIDGYPGILLQNIKGAQSSTLARVVDDFGNATYPIIKGKSPLSNISNKTLSDLEHVRSLVKTKNVEIQDFQFLIDTRGRVHINDPLQVTTTKYGNQTIKELDSLINYVQGQL